MIPKILNFVWIGDESKRPDNCINTWREKNPNYEIKIWGNRELIDVGWLNAKHMRAMMEYQIQGVADMMRYEILFFHGGITLDADSICLRPLQDWLLETSDFACWESEHQVPGLVANGYLGAVKNSPFFGQIMKDIMLKPSVVDEPAWRSVGPVQLTETWRKYKYPLTVYPSHYFIPTHHSGHKYEGAGYVFCDQLWGSTKSKYDDIHKIIVDSN